jgi:hypothetical protein
MKRREADMSSNPDISQVLDQVLKNIGDAAVAEIVSEFRQLLQDAGQDAAAISQETGQRISRWLCMEADGQLTREEVTTLLEAQKNEVLIALNTLSIDARARIQGMLGRLLDIALGVLVKMI